jgi:hypothetical protein
VIVNGDGPAGTDAGLFGVSVPVVASTSNCEIVLENSLAT